MLIDLFYVMSVLWMQQVLLSIVFDQPLSCVNQLFIDITEIFCLNNLRKELIF